MGNAIPKTVAVVGAGTMGSGIAQKLAQEGLATILLDVNEPALERGMARIGASLDEAVARRIVRPEAKAEILARIRPTTRREDLAEADLVIEAVFEDLEVKRELFAALGTICPPDTVLATNTSSFYVRELAEVTAHPERVLGLHYFYHPAKNRLVEVVPHEGTSPEALRRAWLLQERIGKTPIRSADRPGFVVNRYFVPWLNEAVRLLEEGVADLPTIEHVAKQVFGVGMGPFELMNVTGVPIALHAARTLGRELGALYAPSARLAAQVEAGAPWPLEGEPGERGAAEVRERMLGIVFHVATELVDEGVATIEDTDIGARVGLRWPKGPFERINEIGVSEALRLAEAAASRYGAAVPALLREQARRGEPFPIELVRLEVDERGTATLTLNRPDALNALNPALMQQLAERFAQASAREDVRAIVLRGAGKAFVAGADVRWFVERIEAGEIGEIIEFTARGHALLRAIREAAVPVIAVLDGLSLGGGSELALACDAIVATGRGSLGFPETGIGIYPGLGGTQNLPRRVGTGLARYLIYTGAVLGAEQAAELGLVDRLVALEELDAAIEEIAGAGKPAGERRPAEPTGRWAEIARAFDVPADAILAGEVTSDDPEIARAYERVRTRKAPLALRKADALIGRALELPYDEGLRAELAGLEEIFRSRDALVGLRSVLDRSRPSFEGR